VESKARILVVDDEKYICEIIRNVLADNGDYAVSACTDPAKAMEMIENEPVDLVLTDLVMGKYSGVDIMKSCIEHQPDAVVIFMTGHPTIENAISVLRLGAYDYLIKPFKLESLKASVERGLEKLFLYRENIHLKNTVSLHQISEAMGSEIHLDSLLKLVFDSVVAEFEASMVTIALLEKDPNELVLKAHHGDWERIKQIPVLIGRDRRNAAVLKSGRAEIMEELPTECAGGSEKRGSASSVICAPLFAKGKVIGTLNMLRSGKSHAFTTGDLQSLSIIASKAASAIENSRLYDQLESAYLSTIRALANAVEARDHCTRGHTERVTLIAEVMARHMGWSEEQLKWLTIGATLHDIGKIGVPDCILNKPGPLDAEEFEVMRQHPEMGARMLDGIPFLKPILPYVLHHHERWDGCGYPEGLRGTEIPVEGRLLAIADTVDAVLSNRPYRKANTPEKAVKELVKYKEIQFDPELVDVFVDLWKAGRAGLKSLYPNEYQSERVSEAASTAVDCSRPT
jgi:response regulator RpfG family c-di-GMP phosphodiesterase